MGIKEGVNIRRFISLANYKYHELLVLAAIKMSNTIHLIPSGDYESEYITFTHNKFWMEVFLSIQKKTSEVLLLLINRFAGASY